MIGGPGRLLLLECVCSFARLGESEHFFCAESVWLVVMKTNVLGAISLGQWLRSVLPHESALLSTEREDVAFFLSHVRVMAEEGQRCPSDVRLMQVDTHRNAVNDVLLQVVRGKKNNSLDNNVLGAGLWVSDAARSIQCGWPNLAVSTIQTQSWEQLHAHLGTDVFRFLLLKTTLFVPLGKGFLQVCGPPPSRPVPAAAQEVERWRVFYHAKFIKKAGFEPGHAISAAAPTERFANQLCRWIFKCPDGKRLHRRYLGVRPLLRKLAQKQAFGKVPYGLLLQVLCPLPSAAAPTEDEQVVKFVWACLLKLIPRAMWGNMNNMKIVRAMIVHFVELRRYETFQLDRFVGQWRMHSCQWIPKTRTPTQFRVHRTMVHQWLAWVMNELVIPLIRNHFYVTESGVAGHGVRVFYFRKPLWKQLVARAGIEERLSLGPAPTARETVSARLRLVPKSINDAQAMRVIARVMHNKRLRVVLDVMRWELFENGKSDKLLGASVFGFHDVFRRLAAFKKSQSSSSWFFVKVDVRAAYDSIRQEDLCRILSQNDLFSHERYCLQRYRVNGKMQTHVSPDVVQELCPRAGAGQVVTDCAWLEFIDRRELFDLLFEHIRLNVVLFRGQRFRQGIGIPQGSVLSSLLCALYYGHRDVALPGLMMRWTDDTIFITPHREAAVAFAEQHTGVDFGADKACANFALPGFKCSSPDQFAWCGLLFDTRTLEVSWDYARYQGTRISDTLTVNGASLLEKLKQYVAAKCLAVLMSRQVNSYNVIWLNVYQMFLFVAMKFHCVCLVQQQQQHDDNFLFRCIVQLAEWTVSLLPDVHPQCVRYLCMQAFYNMFLNRGVRLELVPKLAAYLEQNAPSYLRMDLAHVVDWSLSSVFERILF